MSLSLSMSAPTPRVSFVSPSAPSSATGPLASRPALRQFALALGAAGALFGTAVASAQALVNPGAPAAAVVGEGGLGGTANAVVAQLLVERSVPTVEIWRSGSNLPRQPQRRHKGRFAQIVLDPADELVAVRLQFHPSLAGTVCFVTPPDGWSLVTATGDPDASALEGGRAVRIRPNGKVTFLLQRELGAQRGDVRLLVNRIVTHLPFVVLSAEQQARLRAIPAALADLDLR